VAEKYPPGTPRRGRVRNLTNYGAFVEIEEGIDGLLHVSDMSWTKKVTHPSEMLKKGDVRSSAWCSRSTRTSNVSPWGSSS
jgi:small subunit ribosomal protein S1